MRLKILEAAAQAILEQSDYYLQKSGTELAASWEDAVDGAVRKLLRFPQIGSPVRFRSARLADLRWIPVPEFPRHLIFYRYHSESETIQIVHLIHGARDLPVLLDQISEIGEGSA